MDLEDLRYHRTGYFDQGRKSDSILAFFLGHLRGDGQLPKRWRYHGQESFQRLYGDLGHVLWAPARSSHLLLLGGHKVLRIWTDTSNSCFVDVNDVVAGELSRTSQMTIEVIPKGNMKKCKPFTRRVKVEHLYQAKLVVQAVKRIYGMDNKAV